MSKLTTNTTTIQNLINQINNLPPVNNGTNTDDATITADEVFAGEVAYGAEGKVTGTFTIDSELTTQNDLISQISQLVTTKANPQGGTNTDDATATASDILSGKTAYAKGSKLTGTIATVTQATPSVSVSSSGLITASATQSAGYIVAGTKSGTKQLTTQAAKTVTPTTSSQTAVSSGVYTTGAITVGAIPSDYIVTDEITAQDSLISQIQTALQGKAAGGGSAGGSFPTYSVTVDVSSTAGTGMNVMCIAYTKPDGTFYEDLMGINSVTTQTYSDVSGLFIIFDGMDGGMIQNHPPITNGNVVQNYHFYGLAVFDVTGNGSITLS